MKLTVQETFSDRNVAIIGLGYVGLTLAVVMAELGFNILGVENNPNTLDFLSKGEPHFFEPGLKKRLFNVWNNKNLIVTESIPNGYDGSVFIITVGTPLNENGEVRLEMVERVSQEIASKMKPGSLIIGRSTVKIGTTEDVIRPILLNSNKPFDIAFCPERTLEGKALEELRVLPQIVGADTAESAMRTTQIFQYITPTVIRVNDTKTAEMIKLIDNTSRDVGFAFANEVAAMCDAIGISAMDVISAGKQGYPRTNVPLPGPVGGPCLSKDPHILVQSLSKYGYLPRITTAARLINENQPHEVSDFLFSHRINSNQTTEKLNISLLGLAFKGKPETDDLRGSMALPILESLKDTFKESRFLGFDPLIGQETIESIGLIYSSDLVNSFNKSDISIILNNHSIFSTLSLNEVASRMNTYGIIYDYWNHFRSEEYFNLPNNVKYISLGSHRKVN